MMPYFRVHCAACGGVECHRLAEIVKLTGMESDQHLVEWVEQAKALEAEQESLDWSEASEGEAVRLRTFIYSLDVGRIVVQWPEPLPADADDLDVIMKWFALIERQIAKRLAESAPQDEREAWLDGRARVKPAKEKP